ncbi:MAG TPA: DNA-3-methyladenine glycosylase 2 family protein, partial [Dehalococcoidia bacterium]|nr:DNA-3-methyladenine glycosylase 2 family protein [Dehalococcoidia bacterium]
GLTHLRRTGHLEVRPRGPFDLAVQNRHFGEWALSQANGAATATMAFPVEGWEESAAVTLTQEPGGEVSAAVFGVHDGERAVQQALAVESLDVDGSGYPAVGERDPVIGKLQEEHAYLRPVLFHSPYEAACSFIIGHRIRITQGRDIRRRIAEAHGAAIDVDGATVHAFPLPQELLALPSLPGVPPVKIERLHAAADAALDGTLDRATLRGMPYDVAVSRVKRIKGLGDFFAAGVVLRGAGTVDVFPGDPITVAGIHRFYGVDSEDDGAVEQIVEGWRPYRTWCSVLVHASERGARAA